MQSHQNPYAEWIISKEPIAPATTKQEAVDQFESSYPKEERWRLLVDGYLYSSASPNRDETGWMQYEFREPHSIMAYFVAWQFCLRTLKLTTERTPLTVSFLLKLHQLVTDNVVGVHGKSGKFRVGPDRETFVLGFDAHCITQAGAIDLVKSLKKNQALALYFTEDNANLNMKTFTSCCFLHITQTSIGPDIIAIREGNLRPATAMAALSDQDKQHSGYLMVLYDPESGYSTHKMLNAADTTDIDDIIYTKIMQQGILYIASTAADHELGQLVLDTLNKYNKKIVTLLSDTDKLSLIGKTVERLERLHPFEDANGRVFVNLLLNYLLLEEGFPPATLFDPNLFDAHGYHADVLTKGILNTQAIYAGEKALFGFTVEKKAVMQMIMERALIKDLLSYLTDIQWLPFAAPSLFNMNEFLMTLDHKHFDACQNHPNHIDLPNIRLALPRAKYLIQKYARVSDKQHDLISQIFDRFTMPAPPSIDYEISTHKSTLFSTPPLEPPAQTNRKKRNDEWWSCHPL